MTPKNPVPMGLTLLLASLIPPLQAQLVNRYHFDQAAGDATGSTVTDTVSGADGVVRGAGATFTGFGLDLPGGSSATQAYLDLPNGLISSKTAVTLEGWVTIDSTDQNWARIIDFGSSNSAEIIGPGGNGAGTDYLILSATIGGDYNTQRLEIKNEDPAGGGTYSFDVPGPTNAGDLVHFVISWEDTGPGTSRLNYWRNGKHISSNKIVSANLSELNDVNNWLGRSNWTGDANLNGTFDEFRIYDAALTSQQVVASLQAGPDHPIDFEIDSDNDGLPDDYEDLYSFLDPNTPGDAALDEDTDNLSNLEEYLANTRPDDSDCDNDGLLDGEEVKTHNTSPLDADSDDDDLTDAEEVNIHRTLPLDPDSDGDGIEDGVETQYAFLDPNNPDDADLDEDSDDLSNLEEVQNGTLLAESDSDNDGLTDGAEVKIHNTFPLDPDSDDDALTDSEEIETYNTLPLAHDSDNDGIYDGPEIAAGTNPLVDTATSPAPIHRYSFNEAAGGAPPASVVTDSIGGANGVIVGSGATWTGTSLSLPGGDGATADAAYVDLPNGLVSAHDHISFEAWYTIQTVQFWNRVWDFGSTANGEITSTVTGASEGLDYFFYAPNRQDDLNVQRLAVRNFDAFSLGEGTGPVDGVEEAADTAIASVVGQQYHVVGVWTSDGKGGGQLAIYRDGVEQASRTTTFSPRDLNDINNWLGRSNWTADNYLQGELNEFRIYEGAMNKAAVQASFEAGPDAVLGSSEIEITSITYNPSTDRISLTFKSTPGQSYKLQWSSDLEDFDNEVMNDIPASTTGSTTTVGPFLNPQQGAPRMFFRVTR